MNNQQNSFDNKLVKLGEPLQQSQYNVSIK